jgi:hypothetical protein
MFDMFENHPAMDASLLHIGIVASDAQQVGGKEHDDVFSSYPQ